ncbi:MAG: hypothetical protein KDD66_02900 [Bdellovibrionales bacterium]|nr:hypothetical protein [Bdellovibrionales bacterium]
MTLLRKLFWLCLVIVCLPGAAWADDAQFANEYVPKEPIKCDYAKMQYQERKKCMARKRYFEKMTDEEKQAHNERLSGSKNVQVRGGGMDVDIQVPKEKHVKKKRH